MPIMLFALLFTHCHKDYQNNCMRAYIAIYQLDFTCQCTLNNRKGVLKTGSEFSKQTILYNTASPVRCTCRPELKMYPLLYWELPPKITSYSRTIILQSSNSSLKVASVHRHQQIVCSNFQVKNNQRLLYWNITNPLRLVR